MGWITFLLLLVAVSVPLYMYRSSKTTAVVESEHQVPIPEGGLQAIEYFWRPGCPFCARLTSGLESAGIPVNARNIWENPDDAAVVRSIADGNETVPTVIIGPVGLVNPSVKQVEAALADHAPHLLPS